MTKPILTLKTVEPKVLDSKLIKQERINKTIELLIETFPLAFYPKTTNRKPLKIGVHEDIINSKKLNVSNRDLKISLHCYMCSSKYQKGLIYNKNRYDLNGKCAGAVTEEQKKIAIIKLKQFKKIVKPILVIQEKKIAYSNHKIEKKINTTTIVIKRKKINTTYKKPE